MQPGGISCWNQPERTRETLGWPTKGRPTRLLRGLCLLAGLAAASPGAQASDYRGQVLANGLPLPGATVTASQGGRERATVSDEQGRYVFPNLPDGTWKIHVEIQCFVPLDREVAVSASSSETSWELKILPLDQILAQTRLVKAAPAVTMSAPTPVVVAESPRPSEESAQANDGFLVNGSVNNAATSQFSQAQAFGNTRKGMKGLYTGGIGFVLDNSALDARPDSLSGLQAPKSSYNRANAIVSLGGPLNIPHMMPHGPNLFVIYQWLRNSDAAIQTGLVPTAAQRVATDPTAAALLALYPLPNVDGNNSFNYQVPVLNDTHQDNLQLRLDKSLNARDQVNGLFALQSTRAGETSLFAFRDTTDTLALNSTANWSHRIRPRLYGNLGYRFSRVRTDVKPYFRNRTNVSGDAGLTGNNQDPTNWGPPTLVFSSGIATLTDVQSSFDRNRTDALSASVVHYRGRHNVTAGGDFRRQEFNYFSQGDPRGTFTFTGAALGSDVGDFLHGVPDAASINYGNADKYLRQSVYDLYVTDDWHLRPELTVNIGLRWEYGAPITELKDRLVNLDVSSGFAAVAPVPATSPVGTLTGQHYPSSLIRPDRNNVEPRIGISWRPIPASSMVVRAGYGIYADTSVYQATALQMAEQAPLAVSLSINNATCAQTLRNGPTPCSSTTTNTFGVDPNFRVGYAQTWQISVQRDLPYALQVTTTYLGVKGTRGVQEFLPNTYALGVANPCSQCPVGFVYRTSNGNSTREAGTLQLRRRLRSGLAASLQYTYSKSIDDDSVLGGQGPMTAGTTTEAVATPAIAQNWLNLKGERGLSTFDQRHLISGVLQYTTGMGLGGHTLQGGWAGRLYKEWTVLTQITAGTGLPENPVYLAAVNGTGFTGTIRPDLTGASLSNAPAGHFLNAAAYTAPRAGQWGDAARNSITGPGQFTMSSSAARTFRLDKRFNLDLRVDATNVLNHVVFASYYTLINPSLVSPLFGLPTAANPMRSLQTTIRVRF